MQTDHEKFLKHLRTPEAEKIIAKIIDQAWVKAGRRSLTTHRRCADECVIPVIDRKIPVKIQMEVNDRGRLSLNSVERAS